MKNSYQKDKQRTVRRGIGRVGLVGPVGPVGRGAISSDESDESDKSDGAKSYWTVRCLYREVVSDRTACVRVEKIGYIYPPGACGMHHRMVVGDLCIIPHLRRHFRDSGLVMCVSTLPSPSLSVSCIWGILQSPCRKSSAFSAKDHFAMVFVEIYYEQEQYYTSYPDMRRGRDRRHRRDASVDELGDLLDRPRRPRHRPDPAGRPLRPSAAGAAVRLRAESLRPSL